MWTEREPLVGELTRKLDSLKIRGFLFDLDDTFLKTSEYMERHNDEFCSYVSSLTGVNVEVVREIFEAASHESFELLYVSHERWELAVRITEAKLGLPLGMLQEGVGILQKLFYGSPEMIEGVRPILDLFAATRRKMAVVTHATNFPAPENLSWTETKLKLNGLTRYFEGVYIAHANGHKGEEDWAAGAAMLSLPYENLMGFGDSVGSDIIPMTNLGIRAMAVRARWKRSRGVLPEGVRLIDTLAEAPEAILAM